MDAGVVTKVQPESVRRRTGLSRGRRREVGGTGEVEPVSAHRPIRALRRGNRDLPRRAGAEVTLSIRFKDSPESTDKAMIEL